MGTIKKMFIGLGMLSAFLISSNAVAADNELGIFEKILNASGSFEETTAAFEASLAESNLILQAKHDVRVPDGIQKSRVYVLTSPAFMQAASAEPANTISAQILRAAVYTYGDGRKTYINMANPTAHAMVYYSGSKNFKKLLTAANNVASEIKTAAAKVPGDPVAEQLEPVRSAKTYQKFNGDGPAKMMAKWRNWEESQRAIIEAENKDFATVVSEVENALRNSKDKGAEDSSGWRIISKIPVGDNAVHFGITNAYTENKIIRINSDYRSEGKTEDAPYPGVDHSTALPLEVLVVNDGGNVKVLQYGEMWRMQLYFWDSGYRAFAKNTLIPSIIFGSIEKTLDVASTGSKE